MLPLNFLKQVFGLFRGSPDGIYIDESYNSSLRTTYSIIFYSIAFITVFTQAFCLWTCTVYVYPWTILSCMRRVMGTSLILCLLRGFWYTIPHVPLFSLCNSNLLKVSHDYTHKILAFSFLSCVVWKNTMTFSLFSCIVMTSTKIF